jgi:hypothetical protein
LQDVGKFYGHLVSFTAIWYILLPFGIFCGHLGIFCGHFGVFCGHFGIFCGHFGKFNGHLVYVVAMLVYFPVLVCCTKANLATLPTSRTVVQNF